MNCKAAIVHLDCDLYISTKQVLDGLDRHGVMQDGTVLMFDDWNCHRANPAFGQRGALALFLARMPGAPFGIPLLHLRAEQRKFHPARERRTNGLHKSRDAAAHRRCRQCADQRRRWRQTSYFMKTEGVMAYIYITRAIDGF